MSNDKGKRPKRIDLLIDHCAECPYYKEHLEQCSKNMGDLESFDTCSDIPDWCHLPTINIDKRYRT